MNVPDVARLKVPAAEILVGDVLVGWDRSGALEEVIASIPPLATGHVGLKIAHRWGSTALYIPQDAHVFIERIVMPDAAPTPAPQPDRGTSLTREEAKALIAADPSARVFEVRAGIRHIGLYADLDIAEQLADFYDANVYDWATGDYA